MQVYLEVKMTVFFKYSFMKRRQKFTYYKISSDLPDQL